MTSSAGLRPTGTVTFLFTDVEGSTRRWEVDEESMAAALAEHDRVLRAAIAAKGGYVFSTAGDSFAAAFDSARSAVEAAVAGQRLLAPTGLLVRMGLHVGEAHERDGDYFGPAVNRAARIMAVAHGGQILVSTAVADLLHGRVACRSLGEHQLRDASEAFQLWQVQADGLPDAFPPLRSARPRRPGVALPLTTLVGRGDDLQRLMEIVTAPSVITLTGVGGIGKTRLARQAAASVADRFADGVCLVELAAVGGPELVTEAALAALGARRTDGMSALASVRDFCADRRLLVVLDNCEHVLDAAAALAQAVVAGRTSAVLATSREPLGVEGEKVWPVAVLADDDAVALFADRAAAVGATPLDATDRAVVVQICRRLDGIPLAIELAAARVRSMQLGEIFEHLDARFELLRGGPRDAVERHRTLLAALQWSYDLLADPDRALFRRLAIFPGGCTLGQASAISSPPGSDAGNQLAMVDGLDRLVARSMLVVDTSRPVTRYRLLECLRQFGRYVLDSAGELDETRSRHAQYFLDFADAQRRRQSTADAAEAATAFGDEWDNLRAASEWFAERSDAHRALRLVTAAWWYAFTSLRYELRAWAHTATALPGARSDPRWPTAAGAASVLAWASGELDQAVALGQEANTVARDSGLPEVFEAHLGIFGGAAYLGDTATANAAATMLESIVGQTGDPLERGWTAFCRAAALGGGPDRTPDERERAYEYARDFVTQAQKRGNPYELATAYQVLIYTCGLTGRADEARRAHWAGRRWNDACQYRHATAYSLWATAVPLPPREAIEMLREAIILFRGVDQTQLMNALDYAIQKLAILEPTERLAAIYGAWRQQAQADRRSALLRQAQTDPGELRTEVQTDPIGLRPRLEEALGWRLAELVQEGQTWTRNELVDAVVAEIDSALETPNHSAPELTPPTGK